MALGQPAKEWENIEELKRIKERLGFTTRMLAEA
jgi:hypothetical protein